MLGWCFFSCLLGVSKNNKCIFILQPAAFCVFLDLLYVCVFKISLIFIPRCPSCCLLFSSLLYFSLFCHLPFIFYSSLISFVFCPLFTLLRLSSSHPLFLSLIFHLFSSSCPLFPSVFFTHYISLHLSHPPPLHRCYSPCCLSLFFSSTTPLLLHLLVGTVTHW